MFGTGFSGPLARISDRALLIALVVASCLAAFAIRAGAMPARPGSFRSSSTLTLDESSHGCVEIQVHLGDEAGYCASFGGRIKKDKGSSTSKEGVGKLAAKKAPRASECAL